MCTAGLLRMFLPGMVFGLAGVATQLGGQTWAAKGNRPAPPITLSPQVRARCVEILRSGLRAEDFWPAMHAAEALSLAGYGDEVRSSLEPRLKTETDDRHRCGLARELVRAGDLSQSAIMLDILAKQDPYGHVHACESLFKCCRTGDGRLLREAMAQKENPALGIMAAAALARAGSTDATSAMALLRQRLLDPDPEVSRIAAWVLGQVGDPSDIPQLRKNLAAFRDPMARAYHEHALACVGDAEGLQALARNLRCEDPGIRVHAANFAGEARAVELAEALTALLDDAELDVRIRAAQSLLMLAQPCKHLQNPSETDKQ